RVPDDAVDRALDLFPAGAELRELGRPRLDHLRDSVEHLAAVVGRHGRPLRERGARGANRVADVLARSTRDVLTLRLVRAPRLAAREGAADEQLVGLLYREPAAHWSNRRYRSSPCSPPS